jgi:hypothetical protein
MSAKLHLEKLDHIEPFALEDMLVEKVVDSWIVAV